MNKTRFGMVLAGLLLLWSSAHTVQAANPVQVKLNIPAQAMDAALNDLSAQSGIQFIFSTKEVTGSLQAQSLTGTYTVTDALSRLLQNSGLTFEFVNEKTVTIRPLKADEKGAGISPAEQMRMAHAAGEVAKSRAATQQKQEKDNQVVVQGERDKRTPFSDRNVDLPRTIDDVQPYYIFDARTLEQSGAISAEDFLKQRLTMNTSAVSNAQRNDSTAGTRSTINLRGLGGDRTLVLVNGRRLRGVSIYDAEYQPDINGIPIGAIDRIEVLPTSASGIYGGAAIGGVVNIVLKQNFSGGEVRIVYDTPFDAQAPQRTIAPTYGMSLEGGRTRALLSGAYSDIEPLVQRDRRDLLGRALGIFSAYDPYLLSSFFLGATPNVNSAQYNYNPVTRTYSLEPLTFKDGRELGSAFTHIPAGFAPGAAPSVLDAALLANAGRANLELPDTAQVPYGLRAPFGARSRTRSVAAQLQRDMSPSVTLSIDVSRSESNASIIQDRLTGRLSIPASAPLNPFRENLELRVPYMNTKVTTSDGSSYAATIGVVARLPADWSAQFDYTWTRSRTVTAGNDRDSSALSAAIRSGDLNPFVDTVLYPLGLERYLFDQLSEGDATLNDFALRAAGPVSLLPWLVCDLAMGLERSYFSNKDSRSEEIYPLSPEYSGAYVYYGQKIRIDSAYAEARVPLVAERHSRSFLRALELQLSIRSELNTAQVGTPGAYIDALGNVYYFDPTLNGERFTSRASYTSTNPTVGLLYRPVRALALRTSYASGYQPPRYSQLLPNTVNDSYSSLIIDPQLNTSYEVLTRSGGNPDLKPQASRSWNAGLIWQPQGPLEGLRGNIEYYRIRQLDLIGSVSAQTVIDTADFADRITRDTSTGRISLVNTSLLNLTRRETEGLDLSLDYRLHTGLGELYFHAAGTRIRHESRQNSLNSPLLDYVGRVYDGGPAQDKANAGLTLMRDRWTLGWSARYFGAYQQAEFAVAIHGGTVPSQIYHDMFVQYAVERGGAPGSMLRSMLDGTSVQVGVRNVFDTAPPFDAAQSYTNYASSFGDIRLRSIQLNLRKQF